MGLLSRLRNRPKRVRARTLGDTLGKLAATVFFSVVALRAVTTLAQNFWVGMLITIALIISILLILLHKNRDFERELIDTVNTLSGEAQSKIYVCNAFGLWHHRLLQIPPHGTIRVWDVHRGVAIPFIETDHQSSELIAERTRFLAFGKTWRVHVVDRESLMSYTLTPYWRVGSLLIPDVEGEVTPSIMASYQSLSSPMGMTFDDL